ncbi:hypothetical protein SAMN04488057_11416 [Cyclobacterium lianum]|uniref:Uncharacterized protein n=1 Tax=Cyclobacterium lianum TaxID=388280 RepID=A0A1M7Q4T4_9BACT|nr:hypothetical protein [Cyclobacterium lianum]SHN25368.1 hypothetical protein SAMN04488057_11416 [Cyclobacterium lianum]
MKNIPAQLPIILHYLNLKSGNEHLKQSLEKTFEWLNYKLSRIADHEQIQQLRYNPSDPEVQEQWRQILEEAIEEDDLYAEELNVMLHEAVELIQLEDPDGYQALVANQLGRRPETGSLEK